MFGNKKEKELQTKAIDIISKLLDMNDSALEARFQKTHGKVAISFNDHKVEIIEDNHGEPFVVKYGASKVSLKKKQYAQIMDRFNEELSRRIGDRKDFNSLESLLKNKDKVVS